jgi:signal transduction histidine kinase
MSATACTKGGASPVFKRPRAICLWLIALATIILATWSRFWLEERWGIRLPFVTFYPSVIVISLVCGLWMGAASVIYFDLLSVYFFFEPKFSFEIASSADVIALCIFSGTCIGIAVLCESMYRAHQKVIEIERELRERTKNEAAWRLQAVLDAIPVGIAYSDDLTSQEITGNPALRRQFEIEEGNVSASASDSTAPGMQLRFFCNGRELGGHELPLQRAIAERRAIGPIDMNVVLPSGRQWIVEASGAPIISPDGKLIAGVAVTVDVTDRRRVERALHETDRRKDEFLAMLSHELRNPLAAIESAFHAIKRSPDAAATAQMQAIVDRQLDLLIRLVDDLLDISRIKLKKIELRPEKFDLKSAVGQSVDAIELISRRKNQRISKSLPAEDVFIHGDKARIMQIIINLLNNAANFTPNDKNITIVLEKDLTHAIVSVLDEGCGISSEHLYSIFDMFAQADVGAEGARRGIGIGLSLVRHIVELHGGNVEARSAGRGLGSEFIVRLPLALTLRRRV